MTEFVKPLLPEEAPEPPLLEQDGKEEAHQRARQSLAGQQGAVRTAEAAGLVQKPVTPVARKPETKKQMRAPVAAKAVAKSKAPFTAKSKVKPLPSTKKNDAAPQRKRKLATPAKTSPPPIADQDRLLRQDALVEAIASMQSNPDEGVFENLFELYAKAPDKETSAAATVMAVTYLRTSAKFRAVLLQKLTVSMHNRRGSKLVILLAAKLGKVIVAKPPAPPAPPAPPPGG